MEYLVRRRERVDARLDTVLANVEPPELEAQVRHAALSGGKRVRPAVTLLSCELFGGDEADAVDFAVGIELVHTASLVVDDIIDESAIRRGTQSVWSAFGHGSALLASDGLLGEAFDLFAADPDATNVVAETLVELGEGEAIELVDRPVSEADYFELARRKTGALFRAAAQLGAIAAEANERQVDAVGEYAERMGIAFQIRDDVLDATATRTDLGKPTGHDEIMGRPSLLQVTALTPEEANRRAERQSAAAIEAISSVEVADERSSAHLTDLAQFVVERER